MKRKLFQNTSLLLCFSKGNLSSTKRFVFEEAAQERQSGGEETITEGTLLELKAAALEAHKNDPDNQQQYIDDYLNALEAYYRQKAGNDQVAQPDDLAHAQARAAVDALKREFEGGKASPEADKRNAKRERARAAGKDADKKMAQHSGDKDYKNLNEILKTQRAKLKPANDPSYAAELDLAKATNPTEKAALLILAKNKAEELSEKTDRVLSLIKTIETAESTQQWLDQNPETEDNKGIRDALASSLKNVLENTNENEVASKSGDLEIALGNAQDKAPLKAFEDSQQEKEKRNSKRLDANTWRREADQWLASHSETDANRDARKALIEARDALKPENDPSYVAELDLNQAVTKNTNDKFKLLALAKRKADELGAKILTLKQKLQAVEKPAA